MILSKKQIKEFKKECAEYKPNIIQKVYIVCSNCGTDSNFKKSGQYLYCHKCQGGIVKLNAGLHTGLYIKAYLYGVPYDRLILSNLETERVQGEII